MAALESAHSKLPEVDGLLRRYQERSDLSSRYVDAYRSYCWPVQSISDYRLAPFHVLASAGKVYSDADHLWHMRTLAKLAAADPEFINPTPYKVVHLGNEESEGEAARWWEEMTEAGGEGMVIKPLAFVQRGRRDLVQPAVKCRGREYLCIIYGPEYTLEKKPTALART